jgi:hypothetical protein
MLITIYHLKLHNKSMGKNCLLVDVEYKPSTDPIKMSIVLKTVAMIKFITQHI